VLDVPNGNRVAVRRAAARLEILEAAWDVARSKGLVELTLRDVADRVGMRAPSLYGHFASKHAIYDAMFEQAWSDYEATLPGLEDALPSHPRAAMRAIAAHLHQHVVPRWGGDANFLPVIGHTKTLPQLLGDTREMLAAAWAESTSRPRPDTPAEED
jgi:AcrR family transcriptional regulator